jgi:hypothetical protein
MLVFLGVLIGVILAVILVSALLLRFGEYSHWKIYRRVTDKIFYNTIIRFYLTSMLKLMVGSATTLTLIKISET